MTNKKVLIVGFGSIGKKYQKVLSEAKIFDVTIVSDYDPSYQSRKDFLSSSNSDLFDLLIVCSESARHIEDLNKFEHLAKSIIIEKPVASTLKEALTLKVDNLERVFISSPLRYLYFFKFLTNETSRVNTKFRAEVTCHSWLPDWRPGRDMSIGYWSDSSQGGVLLDLIHEVDYALQLFGKALILRKSHLEFDSRLGGIVESKVNVGWLTQSDSEVQLSLDYFQRQAVRSLKFSSDEANYLWNLVNGDLEISSASGKLKIRGDGLNLEDLIFLQVLSVLNSNVRKLPASWAQGIEALELTERIKREKDQEIG